MENCEQNNNFEPLTQEIEQMVRRVLLQCVPEDGEFIGNKTLLLSVSGAIKKEKPSYKLHPDDFWKIRNKLIEEAILSKAKGKGGSVFRLNPTIHKKERINRFI